MNLKQRHRYIIKKTAEYISNFTDKGCFVETGVKQGTASVIMAKELKRKGYLFDTWKNLPHFGKFDAFTMKRRQKLRKRIKHGKNTYLECITNLSKNRVYSLCEMIKGDICKTVPRFVRKQKNLSVSLLHSDSDLYEPTKISLEYFWPFLIEGGIVLIHDYGTKQWPGIKKIVDEFKKRKDVFSYIFDKDIVALAILFKNKKNKYEKDFDEFIKLILKEI